MDPRSTSPFAWDRWEHRALRAGVPVRLAQLGRAVLREAYQHQWDADLALVFGWDVQPGLLPAALQGTGILAPSRYAEHPGAQQEMIVSALGYPSEARALWQHLLDTDGERVDPDTLAHLGREVLAAERPAGWQRAWPVAHLLDFAGPGAGTTGCGRPADTVIALPLLIVGRGALAPLAVDCTLCLRRQGVFDGSARRPLLLRTPRERRQDARRGTHNRLGARSVPRGMEQTARLRERAGAPC